MRKKNNDGTENILTSWIPEKFAISGKVIKLQNINTKQWTNGWEVVLVGTKSKEESEVIEGSQLAWFDAKVQRF